MAIGYLLDCALECTDVRNGAPANRAARARATSLHLASRAVRLVGPVLLAVAACTGAHAAAAHAAPGPKLVAEDAVDEIAGRVWERAPSGELVMHRLIETSGAPAQLEARSPSISGERIERALERAAAERAARLADLPHAARSPRLVPEDLTRRPAVYHVAVEQFTDAAFAEMLARVGQREGFSIVARVPPGNAWVDALRGVPNLAVVELPGVQYTWTEDVVEIALDGSFQMTARVGDRALLRRAVFLDRIRRYYPDVSPAQLEEIRRLPAVPGPPGELPRELMLRYPDILFMIQGLVETDHAQVVGAAMAVSRGAALREAMTYLEGGNVLLGTLPSGDPYALVGRDSAAVSRALLERELGREVGETELVAAMARDLGVDPARLFLVEQPGVFHLDMAMTLLAPGTVVFDDVREALRLQIAWLRADHEAWRPRREAPLRKDEYRRDLERWEAAGLDLEDTVARLTKYGERFARAEARTLRDLQATGLKVIRIPARFLHPARPTDRDLMNFVNGEAGTDAAGQSYFITQGGDPRAERLVAAALLAPGTGLDRVYFAPRLASRDSLWEKGGTSCRVKVEGAIVDPKTKTLGRVRR